MATATSSAPAPAFVPEMPQGAGRYAIFRRQGQSFGLTIELVREVLSGSPLTRVARAREQVLGVLSLRGEILPVVVIDRWLGLPEISENPAQPILVLRRAELLVGLRVDAILTVATIPIAEIQTLPADRNTILAGLWQPSHQTPVSLIQAAALIAILGQENSTVL